jgi:ATP-dependent Clp protease ATP-binding subunit ClpC
MLPDLAMNDRAFPQEVDEELQRTLDDAGSLAARGGVPLSSVHLLMALVSGTDSDVRPLLEERGVSLTGIVREAAEEQDDAEPPDTLNLIRDRCRRLATSCGSERPGTLHLLIVLSSLKESLAYRVMTACGIEPTSLRTVALALMTGGRRRTRRPAPQAEAAREERQEQEQDEPADAAEAQDARQGGMHHGGFDPGVPLPVTGSRARRRELALLDPRVTRGREPEAQADEAPTAFSLDEEVFPTLAALARNLSEVAARGQIEPLVGRRPLVERILDILGKRKANNPCLVGEPGVGKTAIIEGLAWLQDREPDQVPFLSGKILVELNMGSLLSGTQLRGTFSERMASLRNEVEEAAGKVIVFLDEIHTLVGAGAVGDGALDAVGELSAAMARGTFPCIGATTTDNYKRYIEETPALRRRMQPVLVPEPSADEALEILSGVMPAYARHHDVSFLPEAYEAAVRLSGRYIADRFLPDKAISMLDLAGSRARRKSKQSVGRAEVAELVAETTGIPVDRLLMTDTERFLQMERFMEGRIVGHRRMIRRVCQVIRRNYAGFSSNRPIGSFLFLGPTGVGKTETVKVLADFLFQSREALCRFDMSEFMEPHSVARLIGSPPGYVGHEEGGQLTESVRRRPYQIVLLDEVEKAHRDVLQVLLQLLDDGRLTDGRGRTVDFSNTVVVMTSNLGSEHYDRRRGPIGFGIAADSHDEDDDPEWSRIAGEVLGTAKRAFPIELWNRIEERMVFEPLSRGQILEVARLLVKDSSDRLAAEKRISFTATEPALEYLIEHGGFDPQLGARPMRTTIQRLIEGPVAEQILLRRVEGGDALRVDVGEDGKLVVERAPGDAGGAGAREDGAEGGEQRAEEPPSTPK